MAAHEDSSSTQRDWAGLAGSAVDVIDNVATIARAAGSAGIASGGAVAVALALSADQNPLFALIVGGIIAVPGAVVVQFGRTVDSLVNLPASAKEIVTKPMAETRLPGRFGRLVGLSKGMRRVGKLGLDSKGAVLAISPPFLLASVASSFAMPFIHLLGLFAVISLIFFG